MDARAGAARRSSPPGPEGPAVAAILAGDRAAFLALAKRLHGPLLRFARSLLRDPSAAEEVVQDTWVAFLDGLPGFEGRSSLKTWMFRILANRARTRLARDRRSVPFSSLERDEPPGGEGTDPGGFDDAGRWIDPPAPWGAGSPESLLLGAETRAALEAAIGALPGLQRAVVTLRDVEGLDGEEICEALGITATNQRVLLHRGRTRLRAALDRHFQAQRSSRGPLPSSPKNGSLTR